MHHEADLITRMSASELAERTRAGDLSAVEVTDAYIRRIEEVDPQINAVVIPLFDEARAAAARADEAQAGGEELGALHGVPVTIKEQYRVAGTQTTLGATKQIGNVYHDEGPLVTKLRRSGAIILGKTNIIQTLAGWESDNPVYGRTNNPWNLDRSAGGSSGGEAAIVAAGGSALGLAGDFGGSTRLPAHFCGVHGFKPTAGRLTNTDFATGLLGSGQEVFVPQPGPIARTMNDINLAMKLFAETSMDRTADFVAPVPWKEPGTTQIEGMRIGMYVDNGYFPVSPAICRAVEDAAAALRGMGATVEPMPAPETAEGVRLFLRAVSAGGGADYFELLGDEKPIPQVAGLLRGVKLPAPMRPIVSGMMKGRGQQFLSDQIRHLQRTSAADYQAIVEARNAYRAVFAAGLDGGRFDAVICPPVALPAFTHGSSEHLFPAVSYAFIYNVLGAPAGVVSTTRVRPGEEGGRTAGKDMAEITAAQVENGSAGLPVGVQVVAHHWDDHVVLAVMGALEEHFRRTPDYPDPADLMR
jgi:fatty acid amide hydrolase